MVGFDPVVRVLGGLVMHARQQLADRTANAADLSVVTSAGSLRVLIAVERNRVAAFTPRLVETFTSMTCPCWSTAWYTYRQVPDTLR